MKSQILKPPKEKIIKLGFLHDSIKKSGHDLLNSTEEITKILAGLGYPSTNITFESEFLNLSCMHEPSRKLKRRKWLPKVALQQIAI